MIVGALKRTSRGSVSSAEFSGDGNQHAVRHVLHALETRWLGSVAFRSNGTGALVALLNGGQRCGLNSA